MTYIKPKIGSILVATVVLSVLTVVPSWYTYPFTTVKSGYAVALGDATYGNGVIFPDATPTTFDADHLQSASKTVGEVQSNDKPTAIIQGVKTNPQSGVGGVAEVNQLFQGEDLGKQAEPGKPNHMNWLLIIGIATGILACIFLGIYLLRANKEED